METLRYFTNNQFVVGNRQVIMRLQSHTGEHIANMPETVSREVKQVIDNAHGRTSRGRKCDNKEGTDTL
jgi:hypothetical protein